MNETMIRLKHIKEDILDDDYMTPETALWLIELAEKTETYKEALREIDTHIRSTSKPVPHIIETLKNTLPEYRE